MVNVVIARSTATRQSKTGLHNTGLLPPDQVGGRNDGVGNGS